MKRLIAALFAVALVGFFGYRLYQEWPSDDAEVAGRFGGGSFGRSVSAATAELGPVNEAVTLVGSLRAEETVAVNPKVNGRVVEILVNIGDAVTAGDLIARLDDDELQQQLQQREAALEVNQAVVNQRELELRNQGTMLDRAKGLAESGLMSAEELESSQTRYDVAQAQLNLARAQLVQAEASAAEIGIRVDQTRILAPISGLVGRRHVDPGAMVNASTSLATIVKLDTVKLVAAVPERDVSKVAAGATGTIYVDAIPGRSFRGEVARISPLLDPQTRTAQIEVVVPNPEHELKAEMFARLELDFGSKRDALRIPRQALVVRGEQQGVFVITDDIARFREIQIGLAEDDWLEITGGIAVGETVATMGANLLRDGDPVRVTGGSSGPKETSA